MHASSCSLCLVKLLLLSESPFHVESSTLIFSHLFWSAEMAVATVIAIPAPRSFVVVDTRFTSALLVKLPLYKARQRHLFHQRSTGWLHLSWVVWVLCRSVNLRVMATTLSVEHQRHQNPRHLRAGHCEYHSSLQAHFKTSRFVEVGLEAATTSGTLEQNDIKPKTNGFSLLRTGRNLRAHNVQICAIMCNPYLKSQRHRVSGFEQMAQNRKRHHRSEKSTQSKVTKTRHIAQIDPKLVFSLTVLQIRSIGHEMGNKFYRKDAASKQLSRDVTRHLPQACNQL